MQRKLARAVGRLAPVDISDVARRLLGLSDDQRSGDAMNEIHRRARRALGMVLMTAAAIGPMTVGSMSIGRGGGFGGFAALVVIGGHTKAALALGFISVGAMILGYLTYASARVRRGPLGGSADADAPAAAGRGARLARGASAAWPAERSEASATDDHVGHEARPARLV